MLSMVLSMEMQKMRIFRGSLTRVSINLSLRSLVAGEILIEFFLKNRIVCVTAVRDNIYVKGVRESVIS